MYLNNVFTMENAKMCGYYFVWMENRIRTYTLPVNRWIMVHGDVDIIATNENTSGTHVQYSYIYIKKNVVE